MTTFGLTTTGLTIPTLEEIRTAINLDLVNAFGGSIDLDTGILARFVGILSERYALLWEALEAVYNSQNPDAAVGFSLDNICAYTGTERLEAVFSTVTLTLTGTPGQIVPAGQQVSTKSNGGVNKFITGEASDPLVALAAWSATTYTIGQRVTSSGKAYQVLAGGAASGPGPSFGVTGQTSTGSDGGGVVQYLYLGDGTAADDVAGQSLLEGPVVGVARDVIQIDQPIGGWSGVINVLDAKLGFDDQTDESLRITREEELAQAGTSTTDAIRAAVLAVPGVTSVAVFHNDDDVTNANGVPPHSVMVLALGGADQDIGNAIFAQVAAGVGTTGTTTVNVVDSQGVTQPIKFVRPQQINVSVSVSVSKDPASYPADGDAQVALAIATYGNARKSGTDVRASAISAQCFGVPGVFDVTSCLISSAVAPAAPPTPSVGTTIPISNLQLAVYDTSRVAVTSASGTP